MQYVILYDYCLYVLYEGQSNGTNDTDHPEYRDGIINVRECVDHQW